MLALSDIQLELETQSPPGLGEILCREGKGYMQLEMNPGGPQCSEEDQFRKEEGNQERSVARKLRGSCKKAKDNHLKHYWESQ